jgi:hypothetical protein
MPFVLITKGREYLTAGSKIRVTHVGSFDCFRKTQRDCSELFRSHLFIRSGSSSPSLKIKTIPDLSLITVSPPCSMLLRNLVAEYNRNL